MNITIECDCGNEITLSTKLKRYFQLRDNLETNSFRVGGWKLKNGTVQEFCLICDKCRNQVTLGVD